MRSLRTFLALPLIGLFTATGCSGDDTGGSGSQSSTGETATTEGTTGGSISSTGSSISSTGSESGSATEGTSSGTIGTVGTEDTTGTTTDTTEGSTGTTDGTTGTDVCEPHEGALFRWRLLPAQDEFMDFEWDLTCEVVSVGPTKEEGVGLEMACTDGDEVVTPNPVLEVNAEPATELVAFAPGMKLRMVYGEVHPFWTERWIRLESLGNGDLLFAGVVGSSLSPNGKTDVFAPYAPLALDGVCPTLDSECGDQERLSIRFTGEGDDPQTWDLVDGTFNIIAGDPGLSTWIDFAKRFVGQIQCTDTPQDWYTIGMIFDGQE